MADRVATLVLANLTLNQRKMLTRAPEQYLDLPSTLGTNNRTLSVLSRLDLIEIRKADSIRGWQWRRTPAGNALVESKEATEKEKSPHG